MARPAPSVHPCFALRRAPAASHFGILLKNLGETNIRKLPQNRSNPCRNAKQSASEPGPSVLCQKPAGVARVVLLTQSLRLHRGCQDASLSAERTFGKGQEGAN